MKAKRGGKKTKPLLLVIMDGWGVRNSAYLNAVKSANTPNFRSFLRKYPNTILGASGTHVGLPAGYQGSSEVGHLNIGAGRIVYQSLPRISKTINDGSFYKNKAFLKAIDNAKKHNSALHLMGLLQDEGVHAHQDHLFALLKLAKMKNLKKVYVHIFTDGRDTPPKSALKYIEKLKSVMRFLGIGKIGVVVGRYYAMDRDNRWERIKLAYDALANASGEKAANVTEAVKLAYDECQNDEFIKPKIIKGYPGIKDNDSVIFYNYRTDRTRQLTKAFVEPKFNKFPRKKLKITFAAMTEYYEKMNALAAFPPIFMKNILGEILSKRKIRQLRISETEKYAHVTFFFNGEVEKPYALEDRILIPSPKVATYDLKPEMSAFEICSNALKEIEKDKYGIIIMNLVNGDMVGHTGNFSAAKKGVEAVDKCLGKLKEMIVDKKKGIMIVTADHGNSEDKRPKFATSHTKNPVPFILIDASGKTYKLRKGGVLADIAPTILELMKIPKPKEMTGKSLIIQIVQIIYK